MRQSRALAASQPETPLNILGISGLHNSVAFKTRELPHLSARDYRIVQGFDSAAALLTSEGIQAVAAEERFTHEKATGAFPCNAIRYCLDAADLAPGTIDYVAHGFCCAPYKSLFEYSDFARRQYAEVYSPDAQASCLAEHFPSCDWSSKFLPVPHHMAHAASAFYLSGNRATIASAAAASGA
jgi:carbamoyltransferase